MPSVLIASCGGDGTADNTRPRWSGFPPCWNDGLRYAALTVPGLGPVLVEELQASAGVSHVSTLGSDGRADVVAFEAPGKPLALHTAEDVLAIVGMTNARRTVTATVANLWSAPAAEQALSVYAAWRRPLATRMAFRVIARVRSEERFLRTELRDALVSHVGRARPRWFVDDPAPLEVWVSEVADQQFLLGIRLTTSDQRQRGGRPMERAGALRPAVAAAMVRLAGAPRSPDSCLLDPCCGSGTILGQARSAGWRVVGSDLDLGAVRAARGNGETALWQGDARFLPLHHVDAVVANLPFGDLHTMTGHVRDWLGAMARLTEGPIVTLAPHSGRFDRAAVTAGLTLSRRVDVELLGHRARISVLQRDRNSGA